MNEPACGAPAGPGIPLVSVVVVNYNGRPHLPELLAALSAQTFRDFELIFVDNGSQDGSPALVCETCGAAGLRLTLQVNPQNRGFAAACNQGLATAQGEWIATLNNDARPEPCWLEHLLNATAWCPGLGMVASKLLFAGNPGQINSAGIAVDWAGIAWDWRGGEVDCPEESELREIFGPCAGAALYARRMLDDVGGFDGDFFAYMEDVDLAWRARLAGWRCVFQPRARVYHIHSATLGESDLKQYLLGRNKVWLLVKDYPDAWLGFGLPVALAYDLMAVAYGLARTRRPSSLCGRLAGLRGLPAILAKRRRVQSRWRDAGNCARVMHPLASPRAVLQRYAHLERS